MCWWDWLWYIVLLIIVVQFIRLLFADGDLTLLFNEKFGKDPSVLARKVVWITGASSGIGEYLAYELARAGCRLVLSARSDDQLIRVRQQCLERGTVRDEDVLVLPLDLTQFTTHGPAVSRVLEHFKQIDILVNNGARSQRAWASETSLEVDQDMINLNVLGQLSLTKAVLPHMLERKSGHIVVTSSLAGKLAVPYSATYCLSKFALHGWFESLRVEVAPSNVHVTMVCPGPTFSKLTEVCFTGEKDKVHNVPMAPTERRVSTARCARLMAVGVANRLDEIWISLHPSLMFTYFAQLCPSIARSVGKRMGIKLIHRMREGKL